MLHELTGGRRAAPLPAVLRARRWMLAGLTVSIVGSRVVEGGAAGTVVQGLLPVMWLPVFATAAEALGFAAPLTTRLLSRFPPAAVLVASDMAEAVLSAAALAALVLAPARSGPVMICYLLLALVFPAICDVVEELYARQLARLSPAHALSFNAAVYSMLGFVGVVIGAPMGGLVSGSSFALLVGLNLVLSASGACLRLVSRRTVPTTPAREPETSGARRSWTDVAAVLVRSGPTSPAVAFVVTAGHASAGVFVHLWTARAMPWPPAASLALVVACFGVGATLGPHLAPLAQRRLGIRGALVLSLTGAITGVAVLAACLVLLPPAAVWPVALGQVATGAALGRMRDVLITTLRQASFRGEEFGAVMSWSFALSSLGVLAGSWTGGGLGVAARPLPGLGVLAAALAVVLLVVLRADGLRNRG
ncbi:MFS transporter [Actinomadura sp. K4S16]|uniref:MFS transporter n=1 Tax=Actinomadura sp. K4S16 TaxID=1316147 RepID=UPI0011EFB080|nr:MFS transporter [Actinomadura sp. K4S16]